MSILWLGRSQLLIIAGLLLLPFIGIGKNVSFSVLGPLEQEASTKDSSSRLLYCIARSRIVLLNATTPINTHANQARVRTMNRRQNPCRNTKIKFGKCASRPATITITGLTYGSQGVTIYHFVFGKQEFSSLHTLSSS